MSKTLLAIDDSVTMRKVYEITFGGEDFKVVTASSGKDGLAKASENPSVVLVDTSLDGEDGYAVCKELRSKLPKAALVVMSSRHNPYDAGKGKDAGADDSLDKPFDTQQLIDKVKKALAAREGAPTTAPSPAAKAPAPAAPVSAPAPVAAAAPKAASAARSKTLVFGPEMVPMTVDPTKAPPSHRDSDSERRVAAAAPAASPAPAAPAGNGHFAASLGELGLTKEQVEAVMALSHQVVERVVWEVVPQLAESIIKEEIARLTR